MEDILFYKNWSQPALIDSKYVEKMILLPDNQKGNQLSHPALKKSCKAKFDF